jgi:hypothetical protein
MKLLLCCTLGISIISTPLLAETWAGAEGLCNEWLTQWHMKHSDREHFSGDLRLDQIRTQCSNGDQSMTGYATAVISGATFSADLITHPDENRCKFTGHVTGDKIKGSYTCSKNGGPFNFSLTK